MNKIPEKIVDEIEVPFLTVHSPSNPAPFILFPITTAFGLIIPMP